MKRPWVLWTNFIKLGGLTVAVNEAVIKRGSADPTILAIAAAMMAGGQGVEQFVDKANHEIEPLKPKVSVHAPKSSYVKQVYDKHKIYEVRALPPNWKDFARDIADALLADEPELRLEPGGDGVYTNDQWMALSDHERQYVLQEYGTPTILDAPSPIPARPAPDPMTVVLQPGERIINSYNLAAAKAKELQDRARSSRASRLRRYNRP